MPRAAATWAGSRPTCSPTLRRRRSSRRRSAGSATSSSDNGYYLYKVLAEQTRTPDAAQQAKLKKVVFQHWLTEFQANALIWTGHRGA